MRIFVSYRRISRCGAVTVTAHDLNGSRLGEYDGDTGVLLREYLWLGDMPLAVLEGGQLYHLHADHIDRPAMATDSFGAVVWAATYTPFGGIHQVTTNTGALTAQDLRFPGQWFQAETGLHQNGMRAYDPTLGRYLKADPLGLVDGPSVYGYALQSPVRYTDPTGEFIPAIIACAANPICRGAIIVGASALYGYLSAGWKYFTTSAAEASAYAKQAVKAFRDQPYTIIRTEVPNSIFKGLSPATIDRGITAWVIPTGRLPGLLPRVLNNSPLPPAGF